MRTTSAALGEALVTAAEIAQRTTEVASSIDAAYANAERPVVLLCVLKGALVFTADLARRLAVAVEIECVTVRSYGHGTQSSGDVQLLNGAPSELRGRDVLVVEDIVDTGHTAAFLRRLLEEQGARSVRLVTLLDKVSRRQREVVVDWSCFSIPDRFVVGYGLDFDQRYRNLPDVRVLHVE